MPRERDYSVEQVNAKLDEYIKCEKDVVFWRPDDLKPDQVSTYLRDNLDAGLKAFPMRRAMIMVRYYALRDRIAQLEDLVPTRPRDSDEFLKACHLVVAIAELGDPGRQKAAVQTFDRLGGDRLAQRKRNARELIRTFFSLPREASADPLTRLVRERRAACEREGPPGDMGDWMEYEARLLPWVLEAKSQKDRIRAMRQLDMRLSKWAAVYLGIDMTTPFDWDEHAGYYFLAEAREQGDEKAVEALRAAMERIDPSDDVETIGFRKTRGYRAREYFLEELDEEQKADRDANLQAQDDLIM